MKKYIAFLTICFLLLVGTLTACKSTSVPLPTTEIINKTVTVTETVHDTVFQVAVDNSYYEAYLECQNGKVVVKNEKSTPSKKGVLEPPKVNIDNNKLTVDCEKRAQELYAQWKSKFIKEVTDSKKTVPIQVDTGLSFLEQLQVWLGRIFLFILTLFFIYHKFIKK